MAERYGIEPFDGSWRMEEIFNFIYSDVHTPGSGDMALEAYWALLKMYRRAIARTTNWLKHNSRSGVGALIRRVWSEETNMTILTFNQDLVIENALEAMSQTRTYAGIPWDIETCYGMRFKEYLYSSQSGFFRSAEIKSFLVLKLHGSLNWFYLARSAEDAKNSIRSPGRDLYCLTNQRIYEGLTYKPGRRSSHLLPLVVPPIYEKSSSYKESLGRLWKLARSAIQNADRLIIFGYSFPENDFAARSLLRSSFHQSELAEVTVIDTSAAVAGRISALLNTPCHHYYRSVSELP
ncbi:MAG: hypothetical protein KY429_10675 [Actinobacteria bacterium]|nr:hypothetical protein [Actinomycetota bacterium]